MRDQLLRLIKVQKVDSQIAEIQVKVKQLPKQMKKDEARLKEARTQVSSIQEEIKVMDVERKELESNHKLEVQKVKKWEARLNDIRNQREYIALSREIEAAKRQNKDTEERILDLMGTSEEKSKLLEALSDDLAVLEVDFEELSERIRNETSELQKTIDTISIERDKAMEGIPRPLIKKYERIRDARMGLALVSVKDGGCQGCYMQIPPQLYNTVLKVNSIEICPHCNRILYWDGLDEEVDGKPANSEEQPSVEAIQANP